MVLISMKWGKEWTKIAVKEIEGEFVWVLVEGDFGDEGEIFRKSPYWWRNDPPALTTNQSPASRSPDRVVVRRG